MPLAGALLRVLDSTGATLAQREADARGLITGAILGDATVYLAVTRIGYRPFFSQPVALGAESACGVLVIWSERGTP